MLSKALLEKKGSRLKSAKRYEPTVVIETVAKKKFLESEIISDRREVEERPDIPTKMKSMLIIFIVT